MRKKHTNRSSHLDAPQLDLNALQELFFAGNFDGALDLARRARADWFALEFSATDNLMDLRVRGIVSEIFDYAGEYELARNVIASDGQRCEELLTTLARTRRGGPQGDDIASRRLLKRRAWTLLHWATTFYRRGQFTEARHRLKLCRKIVEEHVATDSYPANGTLARIHYALALVDREECNYLNARQHFTASMKFAWFTLEDPTLSTRSPQEVTRRAVMTQFNIAKCLGLGLGYVHYMEGNLDLAVPVLLSAKTLLGLRSESLIRSYIDVVYACVCRSKDGDDPDTLAEIIRSLRASLRVFRGHRHAYYSIRACNQLALAYLQSARNMKVRSEPAKQVSSERNAERYLAQVEILSRKLGDPRFECYARIIRGWLRLLNGKALEAEDFVRSALEDGHSYPLCLTDGLIARGEARLAVGNYAGAVKNFEDALTSGGDTPRTRATCLLLLTKAHAKQNDLRRARQNYDEWNRRQPVVMTAFLRRLEEEAKTALTEKTIDFLIPHDSKELDPRELETELHAFLASWAKGRSKNDVDAAERLGITKQTYYKWLAGQEKQRLLE